MAISRDKNAGFTLVELLVVITIIGVLMSLLVPAVNSARDAMRRTQCKDNLKQIGDAALLHFASQGHYPSSGWGYMYNGDPDHGFGARQPGGWLYNLLPYMGLDMIHDVAKGQTAANKFNNLVETKSAAIPGLICPTRRKPIAYPSIENDWNVAHSPKLNKTDYAANGGSNLFLGTGPPWDSGSNTSPCYTTYPNCAWTNSDASLAASMNGVSSERSEISQIPDGTSNVFLAGEKYLNPIVYYTGTDGADNDSCLEGNDWDVNRWAIYQPMQDTPNVETMSTRFGSAHIQGAQFVFCDGHVALIPYSIDFNTYQSLAIRNNGTIAQF